MCRAFLTKWPSILFVTLLTIAPCVVCGEGGPDSQNGGSPAQFPRFKHYENVSELLLNLKKAENLLNLPLTNIDSADLGSYHAYQYELDKRGEDIQDALDSIEKAKKELLNPLPPQKKSSYQLNTGNIENLNQVGQLEQLNRYQNVFNNARTVLLTIRSQDEIFKQIFEDNQSAKKTLILFLLLSIGLNLGITLLAITFAFFFHRKRFHPLSQDDQPPISPLKEGRDQIQEIRLTKQDRIGRSGELLDGIMNRNVPHESKTNHAPQPPSLEPIFEKISSPSLALSPCEEFIQAYIESALSERSRTAFHAKYPSDRIGIENFMDRVKNKNLKPILRNREDGDFYAIRASGLQEYWVTPRFDLTINEANYSAGAIGWVFNCLGYEPGEDYSEFTLRSPAVFVQNLSGYWELKEQGVLELQRA